MNFKKVSSDPRKAVWENERHHKVVIMPTPKGDKVLASGQLMKRQIDDVTAANRSGLSSCQVKDMVRFS
jgi:hypothetical protein